LTTARTSILVFLTATAFVLPLSGSVAAPANPSKCAAIGKLVPYCGLSHPEDLEVLPGGAGVITSDMHITRGPAGIVGQPGTLKWVDLKTHAVTVLYPSRAPRAGRPDWGDPACPGEIGAALLPHGIYLSRRRDGAWQLLVVNHGDRESVEFFELSGKDTHWSLRWRGCVVPPPPNRLNDVVALPDGGLLVTTMQRTTGAQAREIPDAQGKDTGFLWRWTPGKGFSEQAGSASPMPNGVQVDAAGRYAYLNTAANGGDVRKIDLANGMVVGTASVPNPDNSSWARDGRLLVAGIARGVDASICFAMPEAPCPVAFDVYAIDPATMDADQLFAHAGPPFGAATVAVQHGSDLLIGSFVGDRMLAVRGVFNLAGRTRAKGK
jgi:SMP-30/gluconolaconase/LRE-like protein